MTNFSFEIFRCPNIWYNFPDLSNDLITNKVDVKVAVLDEICIFIVDKNFDVQILHIRFIKVNAIE